MAGRADILAGRSYVELLLKDKGFSSGLDAAGAKFKSVGKGFAIVGAAIAGAGTAIVAPLLEMTHQFAEAGAELYNMSQRTHESVESLHFLKYAAEETGTEIDKIQQAIFRTQKDGKNFDEVAAKIASIKDPAKQSEAAIEAFGKKAGPFIVPLLNQLPRLREEYARLGLGMSGKTAASAKALETSFFNLSTVIKSTRNAIGGALAPTVREAVEWITNIALSVRDWVRAHTELFVSALKVGTVLVGVGTAIVAMGGVISGIGFALIGVNQVLGLAAGLFAALVSPIGLVIAAVIGLATWFATSTTWGREMVTSLAGWFGELHDIAVEAFGGISDALAAGDLALAGKVALAGLEVAWLSGIESMRVAWAKFWNDVQETATRTILEVAREAELIWNGVKAGPQGFLVIVQSLAASIGNKIGTEISKSADPALAAEQEKARQAAEEVIGDQGRAALAEIDKAEIAINKFYDKAQDAVPLAAAKSKKDIDAIAKQLEDAKGNLHDLSALAGEHKDIKAGPKFDPANFALNGDVLKQQIFGSFSAAALTAGGSGEPPDVKEIRESNRILHLHLKTLDEIRAGIYDNVAT